MARRLFTSRAATGVWRPRDSCSTETALRSTRRIVAATHLFTSRAASGIWRSRDSCSTEEALRLMRRMVVATHLITSRAASGIWRPRDSCSTVVALLMQTVANLSERGHAGRRKLGKQSRCVAFLKCYLALPRLLGRMCNAHLRAQPALNSTVPVRPGAASLREIICVCGSPV